MVWRKRVPRSASAVADCARVRLPGRAERSQAANKRCLNSSASESVSRCPVSCFEREMSSFDCERRRACR
eukprot:178879-Rhodomonas_salina.1